MEIEDFIEALSDVYKAADTNAKIFVQQHALDRHFLIDEVSLDDGGDIVISVTNC